MADQTASSGAQAADDGAAQAANDQHQQAADTGSAQAADDLVSRAELAKVQRENQNLRSRLKPLEDAHKASMPEIDRYKSENETLKAERDAFAKEAWEGKVMAAANKAGAIDPDLIAGKIPLGTDDLDKAMTEFRKAYPRQFRSVNGDGGAGTRNGQGTQQDFGEMIRTRMTGGR